MTYADNIGGHRFSPAQAPLLGTAGRRGSRRKRLSLALQGGGAFGAFTWGVLDRLLEEDEFALDAVSGASAGTVNAVVLASGLTQGGPDAARRSLERFWRRIGEVGRRMPFAPSSVVASASARLLSPYQFNPLDLNPLRDILAEEVDFEGIRARSPVRLLVAATRVSDGALRIFRNKDLTLEVVLASACLPLLHQAVSIDGEPHWDGGYASNPPVMPLINASRARDVLLVQIIPADHADLPTTPREIERRLNQIMFNGSLQKELETIHMMTQLIGEGDSAQSRLGRKLRRLRLHHIAAEQHVDGLSGSSLANTDWSFLTTLRDQGRAAAGDWLATQHEKRPIR